MNVGGYCPDVAATLELGPPVTLEQAKALHVQTVLRELDWNITEAARMLDVERRTLYRMLKRWGLERRSS